MTGNTPIAMEFKMNSPIAEQEMVARLGIRIETALSKIEAMVEEYSIVWEACSHGSGTCTETQH